MPSPPNTALPDQPKMEAILDLLDQHKGCLLAILESEETTPDDKYEALMRLASLTEVLTRMVGEVEAQASS